MVKTSEKSHKRTNGDWLKAFDRIVDWLVKRISGVEI